MKSLRQQYLTWLLGSSFLLTTACKERDDANKFAGASQEQASETADLRDGVDTPSSTTGFEQN